MSKPVSVLEFAEQLRISGEHRVSHPVAYGTIDCTELAGEAMREAAALLRSQHALIAELVEALEAVWETIWHTEIRGEHGSPLEKARSALAKAKEQQQ